MVGAVETSTAHAADGSVVVEIHGEVDVSSADHLRQILTDAAARDPERVVVDLEHVTLIDSTGLSALIGGRSDAHVRGAAFTLRNPNAFVVSLLRKTRLYEILVTGY
jgi:anti-anti-sigma factor